jgi:hypothetical protein
MDIILCLIVMIIILATIGYFCFVLIPFIAIGILVLFGIAMMAMIIVLPVALFKKLKEKYASSNY